MTHTIQPNNPETTPAPEATDIPAAASASPSAVSGVPAALKRRIPKYSDLAPLMQFKKPEFSKEARLKRASTIWELRDIAKRRTPQAPFDYTDGAAEEEITLRRARQAFQDIEFHPGILRPAPEHDFPSSYRGRSVAPIRCRSMARAHCLPSRMAQTTRLWPRRMSPAANTPSTLVW